MSRAVPRRLGLLLIALGLLVSLATVASGLADGPLDDAGYADAPSEGFEPVIFPVSDLAQPPGAPTLPAADSADPTGDPATNPPHSVPSPTPAATQPGSATAAGPAPTASSAPVLTPDRIVIPAIQLDAPVVPAQLEDIMYLGTRYQQWLAPDMFASGWHTSSATLGVAGNTVLNGHHNVHGEVFGHLVDLETGDLIWVYSGAVSFAYRITLIRILPERWQQAMVRLANARWIEPSQDERLTLITCWPYSSNTHRLIIVAIPASPRVIEDYVMVPRATQHPGGN